MKHKPFIPKCPTCQQDAELLLSSSEIYGKNYGPVWLCRAHKAWVGCHPKTTVPLGTPADQQTRNWRSKAHAAFDPIWQEWHQALRDQETKKRGKTAPLHFGKMAARNAAYGWLAEQLNISVGKCHIAMFDVEVCKRVVEICKPLSAHRKDNS